MTSRSSSRFHCRLASPLRHVRAINALGLLRGLRHAWHRQPTTGLALQLAGCQPGEATPERFPRSPPSGRRASRPALPRQHRHAYAAGLQRGLPAGIERPASESPPRGGVRCTRPASSRLEPVEPLRGVRHWFLSYGVSPCLPDPRRLEVPGTSRRCQGCSHLPARLRGSAALSFTGLLRQAGGGVFHPYPVNSGASWRTSILFHLDVPGGMWQTVIARPAASARAASSFFHSRSRQPLEPPASAVIRSDAVPG